MPLPAHAPWVRALPDACLRLRQWPIAQARDAIIHYRKEHDITTPIVCAGPQAPPPFQVAHLLSFWKKDAVTG